MDHGLLSRRGHSEAAGWPHLVQLLAETAVDMLNDRGGSAMTPGLLEEAFGEAAQAGDTVLRQLMEGESRLPGEWEYLKGFRRHDTQPPPDDEAVYRSLRHRELIAEVGDDWRLRVPLMQRWLRR